MSIIGCSKLLSHGSSSERFDYSCEHPGIGSKWIL